jgi:hypothetical protein
MEDRRRQLEQRGIISVSTRVIFSCIGHDWGSPRKTASDPDR